MSVKDSMSTVIKLGKNKIGLLSNDKIVCWYRVYVFGGLLTKNYPYVNVSFLTGSLKDKSISINPITGKVVTLLNKESEYDHLTFKFLREYKKIV